MANIHIANLCKDQCARNVEHIPRGDYGVTG